MNETPNVIETKAEELPVGIAADNLVQMANQAEQRISAIKRIKAAALSVTSQHDWIDQNGKPYLQVSGAEKIARLFGISWSIDEPVITVEDDGHYSFTYKGYFSLGTATIEAIGSRGSKDGFFSKSKNGDKPPSEIDKNDVKKSAYTNLLGNGITRILGLRNLTWEEVRGAGIDQSKTGKVEYAKAEMSKEVVDLRKKIGDMLIEMGGDKEEASNLLMRFTSFVDKTGKEVRGKSSLNDLTEKAIPVVYQKVKETYDEWKAGEVNGAGIDLE